MSVFFFCQDNYFNFFTFKGMSVTAGKFMNKDEILYAGGAPRAHHHGRVYIFKKVFGNSELNLKTILEGELIASNFGYELLSADVNNDGYVHHLHKHTHIFKVLGKFTIHLYIF